VVDRDVVTAKIAVIDRCLSRITEVRGERRSTLLPVDVGDITALNLQRAVQAAIDLASQVVTAAGYGLPDTTASAFSLLAERGVLGGELAERLRRMVGFRNVAIHEYQALDPEIVESIVQRHRGDLKALGARIVEAFGLNRPAT
jgi:uncharacterized protein YutE (UPF0331/DUF86 family)